MGFMDIFSVKSVDAAVDAIVDTGDALFYTDEEKAKAKQLATETKLKMLPLFEPFKIAQRYIAFTVVINFFLSFWIGVALFFFSSQEKLDGFLKLVAMFQLGWIMLAVISFYFGGGFVESIKNRTTTKGKD